MSLQERVERVLTELESLEAIYFEDGAVKFDEKVVEKLRDFKDNGGNEKGLPVLDFSVCISGSFKTDDEVRIHLKVPHSYPAEGSDPPEIVLKTQNDDRGVTIADDKQLQQKLKDIAKELGSTGEECLLDLLQRSQEVVEAHEAGEDEDDDDDAGDDAEDEDDAAPAQAAASTAAPTAATVKISDRMAAMSWSKEDHLALEAALQKFPSSLERNERWQKIAKVSGRSVRECVDRWLFVREVLMA